MKNKVPLLGLLLAAALLALGVTKPANATLFFSEGFAYANGDLAGNGGGTGWRASSVWAGGTGTTGNKVANPLPGTSGKSIQISTQATETWRRLSTTYISGGATTYYISFAFNAAPFQGLNAGPYAGVSVFLETNRSNNLLGGMPGSSGALGFDWAIHGAPDHAASNNTNYLILLKIAPGTSSGNTSVTMYVTTNLWMSGATLAATTPWAYPLDDPANFSFDSVGIAGSYGTGTINLAGLAMADNATEAVSFTRTALNLLPTATTSAASSITTTGATLGGTVNDNGATTAVSFDYGLTTSYGTNTAATPGSIAAGTGSTSVTATLTGLTCSTTYHFRVKAVNSAGTNYGSDQSFTTSICSQTITFTNPGSQNFGTTPTLTATASSGLTPSFTSSTTGVCTITSGGALTFLTTGTCTINADQAGNSSYSAAPQVSQSFTVNAVVPGAPTIGTATAGDTQASVTFTAPSSDGGASITGYTVTSSPGGLTGTGASSPLTVTGLSNGTSYTFTVTATNLAGTGSASSASNAITPKASQTITFTNPGSQNFGTTPTLTATASSGLTPSFTSSTTGVCTITSGGSLTFVTTGTCTINADQAGNSSYSAATQVSQSFTVNAVVPTLQVTNSPQTYTGSAIAATVTCSSGGAVSNIQYDGSSTVPTDAGTYAITANCAATGSYSALTNASAGNLIIATAAPTVAVTNSPQTYTGSAIAATVTCSSGGAVSNIQYNGSSTVPTEAGTYALTANCAATGSYSALTDALAGDFAINPAGDTPGGIVTASITGGGFVPGTANFTPPVNPPAGQTFPYEMFGFTATTPVGGSITITLTYPQPLAADTRVWKELNGAWLDWTSQVTLSGSTITYSITDGGAGDTDGAVNGSITDPLGPSSPSPAPNPIPMLSEWVQTLMMFLMIAAAGFCGGRMKRY